MNHTQSVLQTHREWSPRTDDKHIRLLRLPGLLTVTFSAAFSIPTPQNRQLPKWPSDPP